VRIYVSSPCPGIVNYEIVLPLVEVQKLVAYISSYLSPTRQDVAPMTGLFTVKR